MFFISCDAKARTLLKWYSNESSETNKIGLYISPFKQNDQNTIFYWSTQKNSPGNYWKHDRTAPNLKILMQSQPDIEKFITFYSRHCQGSHIWSCFSKTYSHFPGEIHQRGYEIRFFIEEHLVPYQSCPEKFPSLSCPSTYLSLPIPMRGNFV